MAKMKLEKENVRIILMDILNGCEFYGQDPKNAERLSNYVAGVLNMANAVMEAIDALEGK